MKANSPSKNGFSRRMFLQTSVLAAAGQALILAGCGSSDSAKETRILKEGMVTPKAAIQTIGLQLYSIPVLLQQDFKGTMKTIADLGYKEVEFAGPYEFSGKSTSKTPPTGGYYGHSPAEVKQLLNDLGLSSPSAHIPRKDLQENLNAVIDAAHTVGHKYLVIPFLSENERNSLDAYRSLADELNKVGEACKKAGLQIAYHNHSFEFGKMEGQLPYDFLLANTDKELVKFEMDLFWISIAGFDPVEYFRKYPNRFPLVHCKNMATHTTLSDPLHSFDNQMVIDSSLANQSDLGKGVIDFRKILISAKEYGVQHFIVERDRTKAVTTAEQELTTIKDGYQYMSEL